jgi:GTPase SAR1 family protein
MGRCAIQIVTGPAGSGKSTYCRALQDYAATQGRLRIHVANLDPAAELYQYDAAFDIRDLISVEEVMEELGLGPNGALMYCMEYLLENLDWLHDELEKFLDDEYLILDCPGQLELYTHVPVMRQVLDRMKQWGYDGSMVSIFCVDTAFLIDTSKFISGSLLSLSAMVAMELPHITVLTKCDLMEEEEIDRILNYGSARELWNLEQDRQSITMPNRRITSTTDTHQSEVDNGQNPSQEDERLRRLEERRLQRDRLTDSISQLLDDWQMVSFVPLNITSEESMEHVLMVVNHTIQYGEDLEVRGVERDDDMPGMDGDHGDD